jgi:hypothetical protein
MMLPFAHLGSPELFCFSLFFFVSLFSGLMTNDGIKNAPKNSSHKFRDLISWPQK